MTNPLNNNDFRAVKQEVGKEVLKTLAFFFVGLPLFCLLVAGLIVF